MGWIYKNELDATCPHGWAMNCLDCDAEISTLKARVAELENEIKFIIENFEPTSRASFVLEALRRLLPGGP